jgi:hypothetical protein
MPGRRAHRFDAMHKPVGGQRLRRHHKDTKLFPPESTRVDNPRRHEMSLLIEDLARDRIREIQRDVERQRQVRRARESRRAAKARSIAQL